MKLGYYNPQLKFKQIVKDGKVVGNLLLTHRAWGYVVELHYFNQPGYAVKESFDTEERAVRFFDKTYEEVQR